ncbi:TlpA disulfide reductase family protein [Pedobacter miscanthi]|uniref:TlpA family protein disulfide reductase n=1 Tax=Pedobacter miscanthi TaxID=2259170 RepID=UPI0029318C1F|nr:TlpA disulfide reductase family protein [Pedobacter miscanthi]
MKRITTLLFVMIICISWHANAQNSEIAVRIKAMSKERNPEKNVVSMDHIIKDFHLDTIKNAEDIDVLKGETALSFLRAGAFSKFESYVNSIKNCFNQTSYLNMAADILYKDTAQLDYTEEIAQKTVKRYDSFKEDASARPANFPLEDWNRFMKMAAYPYYETYAKILHVKGKNELAFFYEQKALKNIELQDMDQPSLELYTALLETAGQDDKAYDILLKMARMGKSNTNMDTQLKRLYIKKGRNESNASLFLDTIRKNLIRTYKTEIAKKMIVNKKAPDFSLFNLNGKRVSLHGLRGKVIVLDFWATWCMPCIASMPAMRKLSSEHPEVAFLFIATRETGNDAEARIRAFLKSQRFPFNVLIDKPTAREPKTFPLAAAFKLTGIPAKVVMDRQGKLRFSSVGYSSDKELINEMEAMIAIAKAQ